MQATGWRRLAAAAGALGGALWIVFAVLAAGEPAGCVGDECALRSHRDLGGIEALLWGGALLMSVGLAGASAGSRRLRAASAAVAGGIALVVAGVLAGAVSGWDGSWWALVVPGLAAWTAGFAFAGLALVRSPATPRWLGALLVVASVALFAANDQDARVLLLVPFGVAWTLLGTSWARTSVVSSPV